MAELNDVDKTILQQTLSRILASPNFVNSDRSRKFLKYIVDEHFAGRKEKISGKTIAQDVFGKDQTFDPSVDPIVRVHAARLREKLLDYFTNQEPEARVRIEIPKGVYKPNFIVRPMEPAAAEHIISKKQPLLMLGMISVITILFLISGIKAPEYKNQSEIAVATVNSLTHAQPSTEAALVMSKRYPSVVVLPFENVTGSNENDILKMGLQYQLTADLRRFKLLKVGTENATVEEFYTLGGRHADYVVTGIIITADEELDLVLKLIDSKTRGTLLQRRMTRSVKEESYTKVLSDISLEISSELASTYGPIISQESFNPEDALKHSEYNVNNHNTLKCYALYIHFSNAPSQEAFESAYKCLTHEINNFEDASFIAMRSWVIFMASPKAGISSGVATPNAYRTAHLDGDFTVEAAERIARYAVSLERDNDDAQNILGRIQLSTGKLKQATLSMRRAVEANPADPDNLMDLAVLLAHSGAWEESLRLADQAISRHPNPPGWYYLPYLFEGLVTDDAAKVQPFLQTNLIALSPINMIYHFAAASMAGDEARVKQLTPQLVDFFSATDINPKLFLMDTIYSAEICDAVWQTLVREGIGYS